MEGCPSFAELDAVLELPVAYECLAVTGQLAISMIGDLLVHKAVTHLILDLREFSEARFIFRRVACWLRGAELDPERGYRPPWGVDRPCDFVRVISEKTLPTQHNQDASEPLREPRYLVLTHAEHLVHFESSAVFSLTSLKHISDENVGCIFASTVALHGLYFLPPTALHYHLPLPARRQLEAHLVHLGAEAAAARAALDLAARRPFGLRTLLHATMTPQDLAPFQRNLTSLGVPLCCLLLAMYIASTQTSATDGKVFGETRMRAQDREGRRAGGSTEVSVSVPISRVETLFLLLASDAGVDGVSEAFGGLLARAIEFGLAFANGQDRVQCLVGRELAVAAKRQAGIALEIPSLFN